MRLLICSLALCASAACTLPAVAQSPAPAPPVTLLERLPHFDSRTSNGIFSNQTAAAKALAKAPRVFPAPTQVASLKMLAMPSLRSTTCYALREYQYAPGADAAERKSVTTCVPRKNGAKMVEVAPK